MDGQPNKFWMMFGSPFKINFRFESKIFKRMINGFAKIVHFDVAAIEYNKMRRWTYLNFAKIGVVEVKTMLLFHDLYWTDYQTSFLDDVWQSVQDRLWLRTQVVGELHIYNIWLIKKYAIKCLHFNCSFMTSEQENNSHYSLFQKSV